MKWKAISRLTNARTKKFVRLERLSRLLKALAIAIILLLILPLLTGCAANNPLPPHENCRKFVVTYGDVVECMIKLDERQKN